MSDIDAGAAVSLALDPSDRSPFVVGGVQSQVFVTHYGADGTPRSTNILGSPYSSNSIPVSMLARFSPALGELQVIAPIAENGGFLIAGVSPQGEVTREANLAIPRDATLFPSMDLDPQGRILIGWQSFPATGLGLDLGVGVVETNYSLGSIHSWYSGSAVSNPQLQFVGGDELLATWSGPAGVEIARFPVSGSRSKQIPVASPLALLSVDSNGGGVVQSVARIGYGLVQWDRSGSLVASNYWPIDGALPLGLVSAGDGGHYLLGSLPGSVGTERLLHLSRIGASGDVLWSDTCGPFGTPVVGSIAVAETGASLVGVSSSTGFVAVAHSPLGVHTWSYSDPSTSWAPASYPNGQRMISDGLGNWYCVSKTIGSVSLQVPKLVKLSADGALLWSRSDKPILGSRDTPSAILRTTDGALVVAAENLANSVAGGRAAGYPAGIVLKLDGAGRPLWTNSLPSATHMGLAAGPPGETYLSGASIESPFTHWQCFALAYSADGAPLWTRTVAPAGANPPAPVFVGSGPDGNLVVGAGGASGVFFTAKYSPVGVQVWTNRYIGVGLAGYDTPMAMAVGPTGDIHWTGVAVDSGGNSQQMNLRISSDGKLLWSKRTAPAFEVISAVVDPHGAFSFVGNTSTTVAKGYGDGFLRRVSPGGDNLPLLEYDDPSHGWDQFSSVVVDSEGSLCVAGARSGVSPYGASDVVIRYSLAGVPLWTNSFSAGPNTHAHVRRLLADPAGGFFVTGEVHAEPGSVGAQSSILTRRIALDGRELWHHVYQPKGAFESRVHDMVLGPSGHPVVAGSVARSTGGADLLIYQVGEAGLTASFEAGAWKVETLGEAGRNYEIQRASALNGVWQTLSRLATDASARLTFVDEDPLPVEAFYRFIPR